MRQSRDLSGLDEIHGAKVPCTALVLELGAAQGALVKLAKLTVVKAKAGA